MRIPLPRRPLVLPLLALALHGITPAGAEEAGIALKPVPAKGRQAPPSLLLSDARLAGITRQAAEDPLMRDLLKAVKKGADSRLETPVVTRPEGSQILEASRQAKATITSLALQYRLTGDRRYLDRAVLEMREVCAWEDWGPKHFLDTAEMAYGVALGYTWLYDDLDAPDRALIETGLLNNALALAPDSYLEGKGRSGQWRAMGEGTAKNNWNFVCNSGLLAAAYALKHKEPDLARVVEEGAVKSLPLAMDSYKPDGAWPEGPTYWSYGTAYLVGALALLEENGDAAGLADRPGFKDTLPFAVHVVGPTRVGYNFADGGPPPDSKLAVAAFSWLAQRNNAEDMVAIARDRLARGLARPGEGGQVHEVLWFPAAGDARDGYEALPLDAHFRGDADVAFFRSSWTDPDAVWLGVKAGWNQTPHGHLDQGSFMLEADGVRWALDQRSEKYSLPGFWDMRPGGQRWKYLRLNNWSHNTISPAGVLQAAMGRAEITAFETSPTASWAVVDLAGVYPGYAERFQRGFALLDRSRVLVQDEVSGRQGGEALVWRMLTETQARVAEDGREAILSAKGKSLKATILSPAGAIFRVDDLVPPTPQESPNTSVDVLTIEVAAGPPEERIAVLFTPQGGEAAARPVPALKGLAEWSAAALTAP
jgi:hypothetical protein